MPISSINLVINKALWGLRSQISLLRLYQYQNDFTGKSIPKNIQLIYTRRRSFWVVMLVQYTSSYMISLFGILPLCLWNSIGGCISKTGHLGMNKNSSRPTSSWNSSSFRSSSLKLSAKSWVHVPSFGAPRLPLYAMAALQIVPVLDRGSTK